MFPRNDFAIASPPGAHPSEMCAVQFPPDLRDRALAGVGEVLSCEESENYSSEKSENSSCAECEMRNVRGPSRRDVRGPQVTILRGPHTGNVRLMGKI